MNEGKLKIYTDGGARGNPGPAAIGAIAYDERGNIVFEVSETIGVSTNNQAEYRAVIAALNKARELGAAELDFFLDSELAVKQLKGEYKVKNADLAPLFLQIHNFVVGFRRVVFSYIPREKNKEADRLVNQALDAAEREKRAVV